MNITGRSSKISLKKIKTLLFNTQVRPLVWHVIRYRFLNHTLKFQVLTHLMNFKTLNACQNRSFIVEILDGPSALCCAVLRYTRLISVT
jgi:hypothetical protein